MTEQCPKCGGPMSVLAGCSAHDNNWYCDDEERCGYQAWTPEPKESSRSPAGYGAWRPIDTCPKDKEKRLFWVAGIPKDECFVNSNGTPIYIKNHKPYIFMGRRGGWCSLEKATHWMPLPEAP